MKKTLPATGLLVVFLSIISFAQQPAAPSPPVTSASPVTKPADSPSAISQNVTVAIEDLLPSSVSMYFVTSNLSGLVNGLKSLEAYQVLAARLPEADRKAKDNPLDEAARMLGGGITDAELLNEVRIGLATVVGNNPENQQDPSVRALTEQLSKNPDTQLLGMEIQDLNMASTIVQTGVVIFVEAANPQQVQKARAPFMKLFSELYQDLGKPEDARPLADKKFGDAKVERYQNGYVGTTIGQVFIMGQEMAVEKVLAMRRDVSAAKFTEDANIIRLRSQMGTTGAINYYSGSSAIAQYEQTARQMMTGIIGTIANAVAEPGSISSLGWSMNFEREGVVDRLVIGLNSQKKNFVSTLFSGPSLDFSSLKHIPAGTQIVFHHSMDFAKLYDDLIVPAGFGSVAFTEAYAKAVEELRGADKADANPDKDKPEPTEEEAEAIARITQEARKKAEELSKKPEFLHPIIQRYEKRVGLKFREEIVSSLGNEIAVAYDIPLQIDQQTSGEQKKKTERVAVFIGIRNREAARNVLNKLIAFGFSAAANPSGNAADAETGDDKGKKTEEQKSEEQLKQEQAQKDTMVASMIPRSTYKNAEILQVIVLAFGITDEHVIIADSSDTIKALIDNPTTGTPMTQDSRYALALAGAPASSGMRLYVTPKYFDEMLNDFVSIWAAKPPEQKGNPPLNISATVAGYAESTSDALKIEMFSPAGITQMIGLNVYGDDVKSKGRSNEYEALGLIRALAEAEKDYAEKHKGRYASVDELIRYRKINTAVVSSGDEANPGAPVVDFSNPPPPPMLTVRVQRRNSRSSNDKAGEALEAANAAAEAAKEASEDSRNYVEQQINGELLKWRKAKNNLLEKDSYRLEFKLKPNGRGYEMHAVPVVYGRKGRRSFFVDEKGKIYAADKNGEPATDNDEIEADINEQN